MSDSSLMPLLPHHLPYYRYTVLLYLYHQSLKSHELKASFLLHKIHCRCCPFLTEILSTNTSSLCSFCCSYNLNEIGEFVMTMVKLMIVSQTAEKLSIWHQQSVYLFTSRLYWTSTVRILPQEELVVWVNK